MSKKAVRLLQAASLADNVSQVEYRHRRFITAPHAKERGRRRGAVAQAPGRTGPIAQTGWRAC